MGPYLFVIIYYLWHWFVFAYTLLHFFPSYFYHYLLSRYSISNLHPLLSLLWYHVRFSAFLLILATKKVLRKESYCFTDYINIVAAPLERLQTNKKVALYSKWHCNVVLWLYIYMVYLRMVCRICEYYCSFLNI